MKDGSAIRQWSSHVAFRCRLASEGRLLLCPFVCITECAGDEHISSVIMLILLKCIALHSWGQCSGIVHFSGPCCRGWRAHVIDRHMRSGTWNLQPSVTVYSRHTWRMLLCLLQRLLGQLAQSICMALCVLLCDQIHVKMITGCTCVTPSAAVWPCHASIMKWRRSSADGLTPTL